MNCAHDKIYSGEAFMSSPPKWAWICRECLVSGNESSVECPKPWQPKLYGALLMKIDPSARLLKQMRPDKA